MAYTKEINVAWEYKIIELDEAPTGDFQQARLAPRKAPTTESINDLEILIIREPGSKYLRAEPLYPGPDEQDETADADGKQNSSIDIELSEETNEVNYHHVHLKPSWNKDFIKVAMLLRIQEHLRHHGKPVIDFGEHPTSAQQMLIEIMKNQHGWTDVHDH